MSGMHTLLLALGALALLIGAVSGVQRVRTLVGGRTATGRVVGHDMQTTSSSRGTLTKLLAPVVEFEHDGHKVRFRSGFAERNPPPVGASVTVRYLPGDPEGSAAIGSGLAFWGVPLVMLAFGAVLVALALSR